MVRAMKHTELGDIPVNWELQTFEETFRILSNNTLPRADLNNRGGLVRNIHYGDILTCFTEVLDCKKNDIPYINDPTLLSSSAQLLQDGDVIIADTAEDNMVGKVTEVYDLGDSRMVAGLHTIPCRVQKGNFASGWLGYYMNSHLYHDQIIPFITGIKVSSISKSAIAETLIVIPPQEEQVAIVDALLEIDSLIADIKRILKKLHNFKQAQLHAMFPKTGEKEPEVRLPGFTDAWEQRKLGEVGIAKSGSTFPDVEQGGKEGIPFFKVSDMNKEGNENELLIANNYVTEEQISRKRWNVIDDVPAIFFAKVGAAVMLNRKRLVRSPFLLDNNTMAYIFDKNVWDCDFGKALFETVDLTKLTQVGALPSYNTTNIEDIDVTLPSRPEQEQIGSYFAQLDNLITLHQHKLAKYENVKRGMMRELLTGKIRLV